MNSLLLLASLTTVMNSAEIALSFFLRGTKIGGCSVFGAFVRLFHAPTYQGYDGVVFNLRLSYNDSTLARTHLPQRIPCRSTHSVTKPISEEQAMLHKSSLWWLAALLGGAFFVAAGTVVCSRCLFF